jgi:RimJ/RimL family protein N-acetyltransferase
MKIAPLTPRDAPEYRALMLEAYATGADAFTATVEEREAEPLSWWERRIAGDDGQRQAFGAFVDGRLVGSVALEYNSRPKTRHSVLLIGMYVRPAERRRGIGAALVRAVIEAARARADVEVLRLTVTDGNRAALRLYRALGFTEWGVEPKSIRTRDGFRGKVHMSLVLADAVPPADPSNAGGTP